MSVFVNTSEGTERHFPRNLTPRFSFILSLKKKSPFPWSARRLKEAFLKPRVPLLLQRPQRFSEDLSTTSETPPESKPRRQAFLASTLSVLGLGNAYRFRGQPRARRTYESTSGLSPPGHLVSTYNRQKGLRTLPSVPEKPNCPWWRKTELRDVPGQARTSPRASQSMS